MAVEINDTHALLQIVRLGAYATVLSRQCLADRAGLAVIPIIEPRISLPACLFWRRDAARSPAAQAVRRIVLDAESTWHPGPGGPG